MAEPRPRNTGITEYSTPSGLAVRFSPALYDNQWDNFYRNLKFHEAQEEAARLLTPDFLEATYNAMKKPLPTKPLQASLLQHGHKNAVYSIGRGQDTFVLVMSKGTPELKKEVETEFANLTDLRQRLIDHHLPVFVPQPYALSREEKVSGFSFELLRNHFEMQGIALFVQYQHPENNRYFTLFKMVSNHPLAEKFNKKTVKGMSDQSQLPQLVERIDQNPHYRIKKELAAKLYIMYKVMGAVPAEFSIDAGDFMADPRKDDFDLRLITVRGGWKKVNDEEFGNWIKNLQFGIPTLEASLAGYKRPLFDYDTELILACAIKGQNILNLAIQTRKT